MITDRDWMIHECLFTTLRVVLVGILVAGSCLSICGLVSLF